MLVQNMKDISEHLNARGEVWVAKKEDDTGIVYVYIYKFMDTNIFLYILYL
jgi:hypothetical protein